MTPQVASRAVRLAPIVDTIGMTAGPVAGLPRRVDVLVRTRRALLDQLTDRARAAGAAGLIAVTFSEREIRIRTPESPLGEPVEIAVSAVPVSASTTSRPSRCFRTALDAPAVATLLEAGWVPVDVLVAGTTQTRSTRHRAGDAAAATSRNNAEIPGPTDMIQRARRSLVDTFAREARALGADGVLVHGEFEVRWSSTYHLVQVAATANVIAAWAQPELTISRATSMS